jgi:hypothetical protein
VRPLYELFVVPSEAIPHGDWHAGRAGSGLFLMAAFSGPLGLKNLRALGIYQNSAATICGWPTCPSMTSVSITASMLVPLQSRGANLANCSI